MNLLKLNELMEHYTAVCTQVPLKPIRNETDYKNALSALNGLLDAGVSCEEHPLADLVAILGELIGDYEDKRISSSHTSPADILRFLMDQHALTQADLPEVGSQGVVSEVLSGKRTLNVRQISRLTQRFGLSPAVFLST